MGTLITIRQLSKQLGISPKMFWYYQKTERLPKPQHKMFKGAKRKGFTEQEATEIVQKWIK